MPNQELSSSFVKTTEYTRRILIRRVSVTVTLFWWQTQVGWKTPKETFQWIVNILTGTPSKESLSIIDFLLFFLVFDFIFSSAHQICLVKVSVKRIFFFNRKSFEYSLKLCSTFLLHIKNIKRRIKKNAYVNIFPHPLHVNPCVLRYREIHGSLAPSSRKLIILHIFMSVDAFCKKKSEFWQQQKT